MFYEPKTHALALYFDSEYGSYLKDFVLSLSTRSLETICSLPFIGYFLINTIVTLADTFIY